MNEPPWTCYRGDECVWQDDLAVRRDFAREGIFRLTKLMRLLVDEFTSDGDARVVFWFN